MLVGPAGQAHAKLEVRCEPGTGGRPPRHDAAGNLTAAGVDTTMALLAVVVDVKPQGHAGGIHGAGGLSCAARCRTCRSRSGRRGAEAALQQGVEAGLGLVEGNGLLGEDDLATCGAFPEPHLMLQRRNDYRLGLYVLLIDA